MCPGAWSKPTRHPYPPACVCIAPSLCQNAFLNKRAQRKEIKTRQAPENAKAYIHTHVLRLGYLLPGVGWVAGGVWPCASTGHEFRHQGGLLATLAACCACVCVCTSRHMCIASREHAACSRAPPAGGGRNRLPAGGLQLRPRGLCQGARLLQALCVPLQNLGVPDLPLGRVHVFAPVGAAAHLGLPPQGRRGQVALDPLGGEEVVQQGLHPDRAVLPPLAIQQNGRCGRDLAFRDTTPESEGSLAPP